MTFRHQIRVGSRLYRGRSPIDAVPPPSLGETLQAAREQKGVDLHRAERDTKIRAKHLAALETGDYSDLPGPVYTRGFLKNYAAYLGLDADELVMEWRLEEEDAGPPGPQLNALPPPGPANHRDPAAAPHRAEGSPAIHARHLRRRAAGGRDRRVPRLRRPPV